MCLYPSQASWPAFLELHMLFHWLFRVWIFKASLTVGHIEWSNSQSDICRRKEAFARDSCLGPVQWVQWCWLQQRKPTRWLFVLFSCFGIISIYCKFHVQSEPCGWRWPKWLTLEPKYPVLLRCLMNANSFFVLFFCFFWHHLGHNLIKLLAQLLWKSFKCVSVKLVHEAQDRSKQFFLLRLTFASCQQALSPLH